METPFAITLDPDSGLVNKTGSWRTQMPEYTSLMPPCNHACPAGENVQQWLYYAEEGKYEQAWRILMEHNPFPAIMGRVCYHPCENICNRNKLDKHVSIHAVERFLGDLAIQKNWNVEPGKATGKNVCVVGAGPCGLSAAYHLARLGHQAVVYEPGQKAGGMMRFGIPAYRLPREILDAEIARLEHMGVIFRLGVKVEDITAALEEYHFNAALLAIGAGAGKNVDIPAKGVSKFMDAIGFLKDAADGTKDVKIGRRVAIYGGGNTAMDAARVAKRLGAEETVIIYRRDQRHAPAHKDEIQEALDEGVIVHWLRTIKQIDGDEMEVEVMKLDSKGSPQPTGQFEKLAAPDTVILAVGQDPESDWLRNIEGVNILKDGSIEVDDNLMTGRMGLFAGGDVIPANRTVTTAVGHGKKASRHIDAFLRGTTYVKGKRPPVATPDKLNMWYYTDAPKSLQPLLDKSRRLSSFDEAIQGLDESTALYEARRCLSCGNCLACDNCFGVCPDNAIIKLGPGKYTVNADYCKGCGLCAKECPCGCLRMVNEVK